MRILISGGAGFIGSNLAHQLNSLGHEVTVLDNLSPQIHGNLTREEIPRLPINRVAKLRVGDATKRDDLEAALRGQEVVIHLAAETGTGQSMYEVEKYATVNVGGTALLLDVLANSSDHSVKKLVVASSRSIYGEGRYFSDKKGFVYPGPRLEADLRAGRFEPTVPEAGPLTVVPTTEDSTIHPSSVYGITKQTQEALVMTVAPTLGIAPVSLRYQNVYGPGQSLSNPYTGILSIFSNLIRQGKSINIFEDGQETRDFVFISDVVQATVTAALQDGPDGLAINVGSGVGTSVETVVQSLASAFGASTVAEVTGNFRLGDIRHNVADLGLAKRTLDYEPQVSFDKGVRLFVDWVRSQQVGTDRYEQSIAEMRTRRLLG